MKLMLVAVLTFAYSLSAQADLTEIQNFEHTLTHHSWCGWSHKYSTNYRLTFGKDSLGGLWVNSQPYNKDGTPKQSRPFGGNYRFVEDIARNYSTMIVTPTGSAPRGHNDSEYPFVANVDTDPATGRLRILYTPPPPPHSPLLQCDDNQERIFPQP